MPNIPRKRFAETNVRPELTEQKSGGMIGLVGAQGIGKSSALTALYRGLPGTLCSANDKVVFKWRSGQALYEALLDLKDDSRRSFLTTYLSKLVEELYARYSKLNAQDKEELSRFEQGVQYFMEQIYFRWESSHICCGNSERDVSRPFLSGQNAEG